MLIIINFLKVQSSCIMTNINATAVDVVIYKRVFVFLLPYTRNKYFYANGAQLSVRNEEYLVNETVLSVIVSRRWFEELTENTVMETYHKLHAKFVKNSIKSQGCTYFKYGLWNAKPL